MQDLFSAHMGNHKALDRAFDVVSRACKDAIRREDTDEIDALTKTCAFLLGAKMENRLFRLVYEDGAFGDSAIAGIIGARSIEQAWKTAITEAFAKRYQVRPERVPSGLGFTDRERYKELIRIVDKQLVPVITLRNILAHGQWHRALNSERSRVDTSRMNIMMTTRLWHLMVRANLLEHLVRLVHDLAVTRDAFERDFDKHWADLNAASQRLEQNNYAVWEENLVRRYSKRPKTARRVARG
ncbi:hypothetical protein N2K95_01740 [Arthrobacter zhaoxinii]|uniref:HEPN AbiU2-like domain-containing protein n=1 Tax=Arthrobacter zhaoxinii TaxID=2964616 RepID=A0ABY5YT86_9MICC|nr:hypothetical protein [Arthrobacter zhaoxinii]UWX97441.1 hypothetical protein N2K95_01740 [Arthrobacter zhaoxinii]